MNITILDNQPLFDDALARLLSIRFKAKRVHVAESLPDALSRLIGDAGADLIIAALDAPVLAPTGALAALLDAAGNRPVVLLTANRTDAMATEDRYRGIAGVLCRTSSAEAMVSAIEAILRAANLPIGAPHAAHGVIMGAASPDDVAIAVRQLTPRQQDVLRLVAHGRSNQEIAADLGIALATVKLHVNAILRALNVRNRTEAARLAISAGLGGTIVLPNQAARAMASMIVA